MMTVLEISKQLNLQRYDYSDAGSVVEVYFEFLNESGDNWTASSYTSLIDVDREKAQQIIDFLRDSFDLI